MKSKEMWIILIIIIVLVGAGYTYRTEISDLIFGLISGQGAAASADARGISGRGGFNSTNAAGRQGGVDLANTPAGGGEFVLADETTPIRSVADSAQVSAAGNITVVREHPAVVQIEGTVVEVTVEVGDQVTAGDLLLSLDTADLERAVAQAELNLASSQTELDKLLELADPAEVAAAQANLASVQENLLNVQAGPSATELAAAEANLAAAQQRYQDLQAGPSEAQLTQLSVDLEKATIELRQAQADYDKIAYGDSVGASPQAAALQQATIDYEAAQAAYQIALEPASQAELQEALSVIKNAQDQLDGLRAKPTAAELAAAEAQVVGAAAQLAQLLSGPNQADVRMAEISLAKAQLELEKAQEDLAQAQLHAPIDGTVLSVNVEAGYQAAPGQPAVILANLNELELTVNVAEVDISKIRTDQPAEITIDALPDEVFRGLVTRIAPISSPEQGVVNYPVTVQLAAPDLTSVRPGMTAVATFLGDESEVGWLVPTTALRELGNQTAVLIARDGRAIPISVTVQGSQGEWTIVQSVELRAGDEAVGTVSSFLDQDTGGFGPEGGRGFGGPFRRGGN